MKISFYIHLLAVLIFFSSCNKKLEEFSPEQQAAINSATTWLNLVADGKYGQSWQIASQSFKKDVTERQWEIGLKHMRAPYGSVQSRTVKSCRLSDYDSYMGRHQKAETEFRITFENQNEVTEFLTLQLVDDTWRVVSYYLDR